MDMAIMMLISCFEKQIFERKIRTIKTIFKISNIMVYIIAKTENQSRHLPQYTPNALNF